MMDQAGPKPTRLLHHEDTGLLAFEATVTAVRPLEHGCEIALDRTAFYTESGGQPADHGVLAGRPVLGLRHEGCVVWHAVTEGGLVPGDVVTGFIDAARRRDHMQQHTGQHILSQAFVREGARNTRGFHLGAEESTIDLDGDKPPSDLCESVATAANDCVLSDRLIRIHEVPREELDRYPLRRDPGAEHEILRLIEIEGWDWSACGGTHAQRTGEVGAIHLLGVEKVRGLWRVRFLAGGRTLRYLSRAHRVLDDTARAHSLRWDGLAEAARAWTAEIAELTREVRRLRAERGEKEAERLFLATKPGSGGVRLLGIWLEDFSDGGRGPLRGDAGPDELRALASRFVASGTAVVLAGCSEGEREVWVAARSAAWTEAAGPPPHAGEWLREWLATRGGKGGGTETFAQGGAPRAMPTRSGSASPGPAPPGSASRDSSTPGLAAPRSDGPGEDAGIFLQKRMSKGLGAAD
jgi:alanyl-tRNA synthetase